MISQNRTSYNPKAHSPAVYIPCWLIQVPSSELSHQAKILYGRLAQWSSAKGVVHRSAGQLADETGMSMRAIERTLKELRSCQLIGTYQKDAGGINHYQFYEHAWMTTPLSKNLEYSNGLPPVISDPTPPVTNVGTPPSQTSVPPVISGGPKIKEIKRNKNRAYAVVPKASGIPVVTDKKTTNDSSVSLKKLPKDFMPDENGIKELKFHSDRVKIHPEILLKKFKNVCEGYGKLSNDWQLAFVEFMKREKPSGNPLLENKSNVRFWGPGHEAWERLNGNGKQVKNNNDNTG